MVAQNGDRIDLILSFLEEIEKYKLVERQVICSDLKRRESDAEHSWHMAMFILLFEKEFPKTLDLAKMFKMTIVHDLAEIYAGDPFAFDKAARVGKAERETKALDLLFSKLPDDLRCELHSLIEEYEAAKTPEAKFVKSFDKIQPILQNLCSGGWSWKNHKVDAKTVDEYKRDFMKHDKTVLEVYRRLMDEAKNKNLFG